MFILEKQMLICKSKQSKNFIFNDVSIKNLEIIHTLSIKILCMHNAHCTLHSLNILLLIEDHRVLFF